MTDARLRELERRAKESGSPEDDAAWIRAQVNAGLIKPLEKWDYEEHHGSIGTLGTVQDRIKLAAYLGRPGARQLVGFEPCPLCRNEQWAWEEGWTDRTPPDAPEGETWHLCEPDRKAPLEIWLRGIREWKPSIYLLGLGAVAAARLALKKWEDDKLDEWELNVDANAKRSELLNEEGRLNLLAKVAGLGPRHAVEAVEGWLKSPSRKARDEAWKTTTRLGGVRRFFDAPYLAIIGDWGQAVMALAVDETSCAAIAGAEEVRQALERAWLAKVLP